MPNNVNIVITVDAASANTELAKLRKNMGNAFTSPEHKVAIQQQLANIKIATNEALNAQKIGYAKDLAAFKEVNRQKIAEAKAAAKAEAAAANANKPLSARTNKFAGAIGMATGGAIAAYAAVAAAAYKAAQAVGSFVAASNAQELADKQLEASLAAVGRNIPLKELKDWSTEIQKTTVYGDEVVQNSLKIAAGFKNLSDGAMKDVVKTATNIASAMGTSLDSATTSLAQAMARPEQAGRKLRAMNIILTKSEEDKIKALTSAGKTAEAQAAVLDIVNSKYRGMAAATAGTTAGMLTQLKNLSGDLKEPIGDAIKAMVQPIMEDLIPALFKLLDWATVNMPTISKYAKIMGITVLTTVKTLAGAWQFLVDVGIYSVKTIIDIVVALKDNFINSFTLMKDNVVGFGKIMLYVMTGQFDKIKPAVDEFAANMKNGFKEAFAIAPNMLANVADNFKTMGDSFETLVAKPIMDGALKTANAINAVPDAAKKAGGAFVPDLGGAGAGGAGKDALGNRTFLTLRDLTPKVGKNDIPAWMQSQYDLYDAQDEANAKQKEADDARKSYLENQINTLTTLAQPFTDAIIGWAQGAESFGKSLSNAINGFKNQIISLMANALIKKFFSFVVGGGLGGGIGSVFSFLGFADGGMVPAFAGGGFIHAAGGTGVLRGGISGRDSIPVLAMAGEGVLNRAAVSRIGGEAGLNALNNGGGLGGNLTVVQQIGVAVTQEQEMVELERTAFARASRTFNNIISKG